MMVTNYPEMVNLQIEIQMLVSNFIAVPPSYSNLLPPKTGGTCPSCDRPSKPLIAEAVELPALT